MLNRRHLLKAGAAGVGFAGLSSFRLNAMRGASRGQESPPCLVLVQLSGGNDGLNTVVPFRDDAYWEARPKVAQVEKDLRRLDKNVAFAPRLERLARHFDRGNLGVQLGVGYPDPNRSHFKSMEIWHAADERGRDTGTGWVGRLAENMEQLEHHGLVHVGGSVPYSMYSPEFRALSFPTPAAYRYASDQGELGGGMGSASSSSSNLEFVRGIMQEARGSSLELRSAVAGYEPTAEYPRGDFPGALRVAAALIEARVGAAVIGVELGGFDTHNGQATRHANRMRDLDEGLGAFLDDLKGRTAAENVVVLVHSEFGRRVQENASGGTDHGTSGPVLIGGPRAKRGVHGKHPSLVDLDERGDMLHTCDFRSIYAELIEDLFSMESADILGERYKKTDLIKPA